MIIYDHDKYIIHRKELMVGPDHPNRWFWEQLTKAEERAGLLSNPHASYIGRRNYWEALLKEKGLRISGHVLLYENGDVV